MNSPAWKNRLFYGDNLDVLREHVGDESVDLVYLDPPFNSNATYNVLFREKDGTKAASQMQAFEDTWEWDARSAAAYHDVVENGSTRVSNTLKAFKTMLGEVNMLAYLAMMAPRLVELNRVLKPSGSLYLHCDPTASHYLKLLLDAIFGQDKFKNEIVWQRSDPKGHAFSRFPSTHDLLLFYCKDAKPTWNPQFREYDPSYLKSHYSSVEPETGRRYTLGDCTNPNPDRPNLTYEWRGITKVWRWTRARMQQNHDEGRLVYTKSGAPRYKRYLDEMPGSPVTTVWDDITFLNSQAHERLDYPTQKPVALLDRIIKASSNEGDVVLDPFCGCGTAIESADHLKRRWIGIDITQAAIVVIKQQRLGALPQSTYEVIGEPVSVPDAEALAAQDPYQFQWWAVGRLSARPIERKKGKDRGIDGRIDFHDDHRDTKQVMISVKAGHLLAQHVRELRGVIERENAQIGVLISRDVPTKAMRAEAASAGFYTSPWRNKPYPRLQLLTIADLFLDDPIDMPKPEIAENSSYRKGPKRENRRGTQGELFRKQRS